VNGKLRADISSKFCVTEEFVDAYFARQSLSDAERCESWESFSVALDSSQMLYVDFAMSCVLRARSVADLISELTPNLGKEASYLDVGCGYGGFVREFASRGLLATGIELQEHLADFSRANCADLPAARIIHGNFLEMDAAQIGTFDVITCNDVIEHVADAASAISSMIQMLRPGGVLFMEIPNRDCIEAVIQDGHYQIFGLTHLERSAASRFAFQMKGVHDYLQEMGELYPMEFYLSQLKNNSLNNVQVLQRHEIGSLGNMSALLARLSYAFQVWEEVSSHLCDAHMKNLMQRKHAQYQADLWKDLADAYSGNNVSGFSLKYLNSFWSVVAIKP
jgi:2-polyprenyl-3-methyl-5-hydroxy-6-metoxy-1,4-benzoquinol methylase